MNNLLDYEDELEKSNKRSKKSFRYFIYTIVLFLTLILLTYLNRGNQPEDYMDIIFGVLGIMLFATCILGFKNSIQSLIAKEYWNVFKIVGLVGNLFTFGTTASLIIFNVIGFLRWYNGSWLKCPWKLNLVSVVVIAKKNCKTFTRVCW